MSDTKQRNVGLDVIRATAILCVMVSHTLLFLDMDRNFKSLLYFGFIGVELFFVLSGFLIGTILLKIHTRSDRLRWSDVRHFWLRRWFRTLPNCLPAVYMADGERKTADSQRAMEVLLFFAEFNDSACLFLWCFLEFND